MTPPNTDRSLAVRRLAGRLLRSGALVLLLQSASASLGVASEGAARMPTSHLRTATVSNLTLAAKPYSHSAQSSVGTMVLTTEDATSSQLGWSVTIQTSAFVYGGPNGGTNIPAANFSLISAAAPSMTMGQAIDATGGPKVPAPLVIGALNVPRKTIQADATFGNGIYAQSLGVSLTIPARSRAGTYTTTLTVTLAAGP